MSMLQPPEDSHFGLGPEILVCWNANGTIAENPERTPNFDDSDSRSTVSSFSDIQMVDTANDVTYRGFTSNVRNDIHDLAREISFGSQNLLVRLLSSQSHGSKLGVYVKRLIEIDARLDPESDAFDSRYWVQSLRKLQLDNAESFKPANLGITYKNLSCQGFKVDEDFQLDFINAPYKVFRNFVRENLLSEEKRQSQMFDILKPMDGIIKPGEVTVVLGRPGAGCSTLLKTIANNTYGFDVSKESVISYSGLTPTQISKNYRGDVVYCAETENHFPHLTVEQTLHLAALLKTPQNRPEGISRETYAAHMRDVAMATYGLTHTRNTKVGSSYIQGVSGGERKRVSIAEVSLCDARLQCWDNSTRGLDAATALEFVRALKTSAEIGQATPIIAIYQCSQAAYDLFDKVILLYEGYQIYFGSSKKAKNYFIEMGYECPPRQATADFLTSLTSPKERKPRKGFETKVPRTPEEFYKYWLNSSERQELAAEVDDSISNDFKEMQHQFHEYHIARQATGMRKKSPYTVSYPMQVKYVALRNMWRLKGDPSNAVLQVAGNVIIAIILASIFFNLKKNTGSFYARTSAIFFSILFNSFASLLEISLIYEARDIVEKHKKYALYHPSADALASIVTELPTKIVIAIVFNVIYYFMIHLRRDAGAFFFYLLISFSATLAMSHLFRCVGAATHSVSESMTPASILLIALAIFTGFVVPTPHMLGWCRWINYVNPVAYAFEALIGNEFHKQEYSCKDFIPRGENYPTEGPYFVCSVVGSQMGETFVNGDAYVSLAFDYSYSHGWRNWGIIMAFTIFFLFVYLVLCEVNKGAMQKGEIVIFQRSSLKKIKERERQLNMKNDVEGTGRVNKNRLVLDDFENNTLSEKNDGSSPKENLSESFRQEAVFHWRNMVYEIKTGNESHTILNQVDGWVKPGEVTALMGASGAGKTTLLNALSARLTVGVITSGLRMVDGKPLDKSFERSIGYVQQQDLHLQTSTVRESLRFLAYLRRSKNVSKKEKDAYVEHIIELLEMEHYADAIVGVAGEGLNVEQRKRLSIGVELAAKPKLLLFLDEPTSGLDSQTAWSVCKLIRKLADHGQAILCTIHQPSAPLLEQFDRLLFLKSGGETVYFGKLGKNCQNLIDYFENHSSKKCPSDANPAEWMLEVIGAAPGTHAEKDYFKEWRQSDEYKGVIAELDAMEKDLAKKPTDKDPNKIATYAAPYWLQYVLVTQRIFQQHWRSPFFIYNKLLLTTAATLFNGFVFFQAKMSLQGMQDQMFSIFIFTDLIVPLTQQYLPHYVFQRDLYEVRERPARTFSWVAFIAAQITAEIPWNIVAGTLAYFCYYYPVGFQSNASYTDATESRGALFWIICVLLLIYGTTLGQLCISFLELESNASFLVDLLFSILLAFCGVLVARDNLPRFWIFMYYFNPMTYLIGAALSVAIADTPVTCAANEIKKFLPINNYTCGEYMSSFIEEAGGYLIDSTSTTLCEYCAISNTNAYLSSINIKFSENGLNIGIVVAFIVFNMACTIILYYFGRVPKTNREKQNVTKNVFVNWISELMSKRP